MSAFSVGACAANPASACCKRDLSAHRHGAQPRLKIGDFVARFGVFAGFTELGEQRQHLPDVVFGNRVPAGAARRTGNAVVARSWSRGRAQ